MYQYLPFPQSKPPSRRIRPEPSLSAADLASARNNMFHAFTCIYTILSPLKDSNVCCVLLNARVGSCQCLIGLVAEKPLLRPKDEPRTDRSVPLSCARLGSTNCSSLQHRTELCAEENHLVSWLTELPHRAARPKGNLATCAFRVGQANIISRPCAQSFLGCKSLNSQAFQDRGNTPTKPSRSSRVKMRLLTW